MGIFSRLFKVGQAQAHAVVDKLEDPIKLTEQGIRDLKNDLNTAISSYENEISTLRARAKTAESTKRINQHLAQVDSASTIAMLERMKQKVEENEALAQAYGEVGQVDTSVDSEINKALAGAQ